MDSRLPTLRALYISPALRNQGHRSSFPRGLAPPSPTLPGNDSAAQNLYSLFLLALGEKRSNELKIIPGFLHPVHSNLLILSFIFPHCVLRDFCLPEGSLAYPPIWNRRSCGRSPTDALTRSLPKRASLRGCPRPRRGASPSPPHLISRHLLPSFHPPWCKTLAPAPPGAAPPPSAAPGRRAGSRADRGAREARRARELSGRPSSQRLGNWAVGEAARAGLYRSPRWWFETLSASLTTRRRRAGGGGAARRLLP